MAKASAAKVTETEIETKPAKGPKVVEPEPTGAGSRFCEKCQKRVKAGGRTKQCPECTTPFPPKEGGTSTTTRAKSTGNEPSAADLLEIQQAFNSQEDIEKLNEMLKKVQGLGGIDKVQKGLDILEKLAALREE